MWDGDAAAAEDGLAGALGEKEGIGLAKIGEGGERGAFAGKGPGLEIEIAAAGGVLGGAKAGFAQGMVFEVFEEDHAMAARFHAALKNSIIFFEQRT